VSLIETQRSEFGTTIAANGLDNFLDNLAVRVKNLKETSQQAKAKK
jgi:ABC-type transporter MlaC component